MSECKGQFCFEMLIGMSGSDIKEDKKPRVHFDGSNLIKERSEKHKRRLDCLSYSIQNVIHGSRQVVGDRKNGSWSEERISIRRLDKTSKLTLEVRVSKITLYLEGRFRRPRQTVESGVVARSETLWLSIEICRNTSSN